MRKDVQQSLRNLKNGRSNEYKQLKKAIERVVSNNKLDDVSATELNGTSKYVDAINVGDIKTTLKTFSPHRIEFTVNVYLSPGEFFEINAGNLRRVLLSNSDLSKGNYKNEITDRLKKFRGHHDKKAQIFMKSIVEILQGLKYQPQRVASQIHLMEVLHFDVQLIVDPSVVSKFVDEQHNKANIQLAKIKAEQPITLEIVNNDVTFRKSITRAISFDHVYTTNSLEDAVKFGLKIIKATGQIIAKTVVKHRNLPASRHILHALQRDIASKSDWVKDINDWEDNSLALTVARFLDEHPQEATETIANDLEFSVTMFQSNDQKNIDEFEKTEKNRYYILFR